jgi:hypothetical protein
MTLPTLPPPVTDTDLDHPDIRAAARAVVDDLASSDLAPASLHEPGARRRPRIAVAAAVAAVVLGAGAAGYALTAGPGGDTTRSGVTSQAPDDQAQAEAEAERAAAEAAALAEMQQAIDQARAALAQAQAEALAQRAEGAPTVCEQVGAWLTADAAGDAATAQQALDGLLTWRDLAVAGGDQEVAARIEAFVSPAAAGDRPTAEVQAANWFPGGCA